MISGSSPQPDSARVLHLYALQLGRLRCFPWVGFVYSEDNLADDPSRGRFELMRHLGALYRPPRMPPVDSWDYMATL